MVINPEGEATYQGLHRLIAEEHINRELQASEVVHHIDEDKWNNEPNNLAVMDATDHARWHACLRSLQAVIGNVAETNGKATAYAMAHHLSRVLNERAHISAQPDQAAPNQDAANPRG